MLRRSPLRFPSRTTYHGDTLVLIRPRVRVRTRGASEIGHRLSASPETPVERWGLPGFWAIRCERALVASHPAGVPSPCPITPTTLLPSGTTEPSAIPERCHFRAASPTARSLAALLLRLFHHWNPRKGSLLACRAQLWPGGIRTRGTTNRISRRYHLLLFQRTSLAWSHPLWASDYRRSRPRNGKELPAGRPAGRPTRPQRSGGCQPRAGGGVRLDGTQPACRRHARRIHHSQRDRDVNLGQTLVPALSRFDRPSEAGSLHELAVRHSSCPATVAVHSGCKIGYRYSASRYFWISPALVAVRVG